MLAVFPLSVVFLLITPADLGGGGRFAFFTLHSFERVLFIRFQPVSLRRFRFD
jgi:hypothetical protein